MPVQYITRLEKIPQLPPDKVVILKPVVQKFAFRTNSYYLKLIDWNDPNDPIRRIVIPTEDELLAWGELDASREEMYFRAPGLEHKYADTAVFLLIDVCGGYCRFCFRKRIFMNENEEIVRDMTPGLEYIRNHPEINNVLLTGGDPLILATSKLEQVFRRVREIPHVRIIRVGTKIPAYNPFRITEDPKLLELLEKYSKPDGRVHMMLHYNHPRELTREARAAILALQRAGTICVNQTPMLRGVNDNADVLTELLNELSFLGVTPYYVFQCRPTLGNKTFAVPIEEGYQTYLTAQTRCSGLANRARYCMSHRTGKIQVMGLTESQILMRYHRAAAPENRGRTMIFERNPEAYWLDDYLPEDSPLRT